MPRQPRLHLPGFPLHVIQRGNNRSPCFFADDDCAAYLDWLRRAAVKLDCAIHAYVLMTNHVHLLVTPGQAGAVSTLMQSLGRRYVQYVNHTYRRSGTLWEGRYLASAVHADAYLLKCMRYIELNPVRAGMVEQPGDFKWSSFRHNGLGRLDRMVTEHGIYSALGPDPEARQQAYRALFRVQLDDEVLAEIREASQTGTLLSGERFRREIENAQQRRLTRAPRGRPRKVKEEESPGSQLELGE
ncbi:MAG: transposase [Prolixibacteraceae bacterium]|nr:transposase [Burkholderiales bacterium]